MSNDKNKGVTIRITYSQASGVDACSSNSTIVQQLLCTHRWVCRCFYNLCVFACMLDTHTHNISNQKKQKNKWKQNNQQLLLQHSLQVWHFFLFFCFVTMFCSIIVVFFEQSTIIKKNNKTKQTKKAMFPSSSPSFVLFFCFVCVKQTKVK